MHPYAKPPTISDDYRSADLYREAADIFSERGFLATTMADIAESVDLTQGGLYYYVKGKKALLFAILNFGLDLLETRVLGPARRLEDPDECLRLLVGGYLELLFAEPAVMGLLEGHEEHLETVHRAKVQFRMRLFADFLRDVFAASLYERGLDADPALAATHALDMIRSVPTWSSAPGLEPGHLAEHIIGRARSGFSTLEAAALAS